MTICICVINATVCVSDVLADVCRLFYASNFLLLFRPFTSFLFVDLVLRCVLFCTV